MKRITNKICAVLLSGIFMVMTGVNVNAAEQEYPQAEAVFQEEGTDCSFRHEVTIREEGDKWIYLGNCIEREGAYKIPEYKPRRDF